MSKTIITEKGFYSALVTGAEFGVPKGKATPALILYADVTDRAGNVAELQYYNGMLKPEACQFANQAMAAIGFTGSNLADVPEFVAAKLEAGETLPVDVYVQEPEEVTTKSGATFLRNRISMVKAQRGTGNGRGPQLGDVDYALAKKFSVTVAKAGLPPERNA